MHCMVFHTEVQHEAKPTNSFGQQTGGESTLVAQRPAGAQAGGWATPTLLFRVANQVPWMAIARTLCFQGGVYCQRVSSPQRQDRRLHVRPHVQGVGRIASEEALDSPHYGSDIRVGMRSTLRWRSQSQSHRRHRHLSFWFLPRFHGAGNREALGVFHLIAIHKMAESAVSFLCRHGHLGVTGG